MSPKRKDPRTSSSRVHNPDEIPLTPSVPSVHSTESGRSHPVFPSDEEQSPLYVRRPSLDAANRTAAAKLKTELDSAGETDSDDDLGSLPDVGLLKLSPTLPRLRDTDMSKAVTFSGKPRQLQPCLLYCQVKLQADGITSEAQQAGFLASLLRGPALTWLGSKVAVEPNILQDYHELRAQLTAAFELDEDAQKLQSARALAGLSQKGSVHDYALKFSDLADRAGINDATKVALFTKGLKPRIREGLIVSDSAEDFAETVKEATRIDSQLYYSGRHQARSDGARQRRGKDGRFQPNSIKREQQY